MGIKKLLTPETGLITVTGFFGYFIAPIMGITDAYAITIISLLLLIFLYLLTAFFFFSVVEFDYNDKKNPIILVRNEVGHRADDLIFTVELFEKFKYVSYIFLLKSNELKNICFQMYWEPKFSLNMKKNKNYPSLSLKERYPIICASNLLLEKHFDTAKNTYSGNTQTANLIPLNFGLVPKNRQKAVSVSA